MASSTSAIYSKNPSPGSPRVGASSYPTVAAKSQQAEGIELRYSHLAGWQDEANRIGGKTMDTKPRDTKPTDLHLELAVFAAP
jgi:hypothetical protein